MKRILTFAISVLALVSCGDKIETTEKEDFDFGEEGPFLEIENVNGEFVPKSAPVPQADFDMYFQGVWSVDAVKTISKTGKITSQEKLPGVDYPCFGVKENGNIRQYITTNGGKDRTFTDGTYSYSPETGVLNFIGITEEHPSFRIVTMKETEMTGTFKSTENNSDDSVLTLYVYKRMSESDAYGIDQRYGAE